MATALGAAFADGDDLHPPANIAKMSQGHPLDDADRLPWLLAIRDRAAELCENGTEEKQLPGTGAQGDERVRAMAEVHETSGQDTHRRVDDDEERRAAVAAAKNHAQSIDEALAAERDGQGARQQPPQHGDPARRWRRPVVVIACSALKKSYRQLLRHGLPPDVESTASGALPPSLPAGRPQPDLHVFHVYLRISPEELLRRMHARKGHFMKESMLHSQLSTLEEPLDEPDTLILGDEPVEQLVQEGVAFFEREVR